jgi:hypothetical protein
MLPKEDYTAANEALSQVRLQTVQNFTSAIQNVQRMALATIQRSEAFNLL